ncbi:MAG: SsrA-binding protein SmpB, partial [Bacilli bacterium]
MAEKKFADEVLIATNRKAKFNYFLSDFQEAGIELKGSEIKSLRTGHCSLDDSYVILKNNEAFILNMNIPVYQANGIFSHEPTRTRKLLLHKDQLYKLTFASERQGFTIIPTRVYIKHGYAKVQIALAKGKKNYDKRETIKERDDTRNVA